MRPSGPKDALGLQGSIQNILYQMGDDPNRPGLINTPADLVHLWGLYLDGYGKDPTIPAGEVIPIDDWTTVSYEGPAATICERHLMPISGLLRICVSGNRAILSPLCLKNCWCVLAARLQDPGQLIQQVITTLASALPGATIGISLTQIIKICSQGHADQEPTTLVYTTGCDNLTVPHRLAFMRLLTNRRFKDENQSR